MTRLLKVVVALALVALFSVSATPAAATRGTKPAPQITYIWGQRVSPSELDVVVRTRGTTSAYRVTLQLSYADANGGYLPGCGEFLPLRSGAGTGYMTTPDYVTTFPATAVTVSVTATLSIPGKGGKPATVVDTATGSATIPDVLETFEIYKLS